MSINNLIWLFFCYSFLGWIMETAMAAVRFRHYIDRGVLFGPLCMIYGITGLIITTGLHDLEENWLFLFFGSAIYATVIEWAAGHLLERVSHTRWWDYSNRQWNLDGYICLSASLFWGLLGVLTVKWGNTCLLALYGLFPSWAARVVLWSLLAVLALDLFATLLTLAGIVHRLPPVEAVGNRLAMLTLRIGQWILSHTEHRIHKTYPHAKFIHGTREASHVFAQGCSFYKIFLLFFIGSFLGDLTETIFCRLKAGIWMSRSSVVWGPFSIVWGLALALATVLLYRYRARSSSFLFLAGTCLGGAYEYLCSVFTEAVFGTIFWDYSAIPFNLGGRINLLYCFFWGFAAVIWLQFLYPKISDWIEHIPIHLGTWLTWILILFMGCNIVVSSLALLRYDTRAIGAPASQAWERYMDLHYGDAKMELIYPDAISIR